MAPELSPDDIVVLGRITEDLRAKGQFARHFDADDFEGINRVRSLGRRAARDLGWRVRTFATDPTHRDDLKVVVIVAVIESSPLHQQLMHVRGDKAIRKAFESWDLGGQGG